MGSCDAATYQAASEAVIFKADELERCRCKLEKSVTRGNEYFLKQLCFETQNDINEMSCIMLEYHQARLKDLIDHNSSEGRGENGNLDRLRQLLTKCPDDINAIRTNIKAMSALATQWRLTCNQQEVRQLKTLLTQDGLDDSQTKMIRVYYDLQNQWNAELEQFLVFWQTPVDEQVDEKIVEQIESFQRFKVALLELYRKQRSQFRKQETNAINRESLQAAKLEEEEEEEREGWSKSKAKKEADILKLEVRARQLGVQRKKQELEDEISRALDEEALAVFGGAEKQETEAILKFETQKKREWMEMSRLYDMAIQESTLAREEQGKYEKLKRQRDLEDEIFEREEKDYFDNVLSTELTEISRWKEKVKEKDVDRMNAVMFEQVEHIRIKQERKQKRKQDKKDRSERAQADAERFHRNFELMQQPVEMWRVPKHWYSKPHVCQMRLEVVDESYVIKWESAKKTEDHTQFHLSRATKLQKCFAKIPKGIPTAVHKFTLSLESPHDSLVLFPLKQATYNLWVSFLEGCLVE